MDSESRVGLVVAATESSGARGSPLVVVVCVCVCARVCVCVCVRRRVGGVVGGVGELTQFRHLL